MKPTPAKGSERKKIIGNKDFKLTMLVLVGLPVAGFVIFMIWVVLSLTVFSGGPYFKNW